jgi:N-acetylneuraminic acid mutarotase
MLDDLDDSANYETVIKATNNLNFVNKGSFIGIKGHSMTLVGGEIYVFGGMRKNSFRNDIFLIDI